MLRRPISLVLQHNKQSLAARYSQNHVSRAVLSTSTGDKPSYTEKQARTGRPVSPHVTIYAMPVGALSSITNRVTGAILTFGTTGIGAMALVGIDAAGLLNTIGNSFVGPAAKVLLAFPLIYHYGAGLRHWLWDNNPDMLYNKGVTEASYVLFGSTIFLSLAAGAYTIDPRKTEEKKEK